MTGSWTTSPIVLTATGTQGHALVSPFLWGGGAPASASGPADPGPARADDTRTADGTARPDGS